MPLYENVRLQFILKDIFLFKISYISVCSAYFAFLNNSKNTKEQLKVE